MYESERKFVSLKEEIEFALSLIEINRLKISPLFDERIKSIIKNAKIPVGIFIEKEISKIENIFIPVFSISDSFLLIYAQKLIHNSNARVVVLNSTGVIKQNAEMKEAIRSIEQTAPNHIALYSENKINKDFLAAQDLMLISLDNWRKAVETQSICLPQSPSTLILKP